MAIGERIHFFRNKCGLTQKQLGKLLGFPEKSADVRLAQYETGSRTPKAAQLHEMLCAWRQVSAMLEAGEISKKDYDKWRYHYPEFDATQKRAKVMSQRLSDLLVEALKSPDTSEE